MKVWKLFPILAFSYTTPLLSKKHLSKRLRNIPSADIVLPSEWQPIILQWQKLNNVVESLEAVALRKSRQWDTDNFSCSACSQNNFYEALAKHNQNYFQGNKAVEVKRKGGVSTAIIGAKNSTAAVHLFQKLIEIPKVLFYFSPFILMIIFQFS